MRTSDRCRGRRAPLQSYWSITRRRASRTCGCVRLVARATSATDTSPRYALKIVISVLLTARLARGATFGFNCKRCSWWYALGSEILSALARALVESVRSYAARIRSSELLRGLPIGFVPSAHFHHGVCDDAQDKQQDEAYVGSHSPPLLAVAAEGGRASSIAGMPWSRSQISSRRVTKISLSSLSGFS